MTNPIPPLKNEVYALKCLKKYSADDPDFDPWDMQFAHCPYPEADGDKGYLLTPEDHMVQGLLQSEDLDKCCFHVGTTHNWLVSGQFPDYDYFHLWDIYDKYAKIHNSQIAKLGSSVNAGLTTYKKKVGLFSMSKEQKSAAGSAGAKTQYEQKIGIFAPGKHASSLKKKWISTVDLFVSSASGVARHNKKLNYDPNARVCVDDLEASLIECLPVL